MSEELKPCPFCGPGGSVVSLYACDSGYVRVACGACGSQSGHRHERHEDAQSRIMHLWNTRPIEDALQARIVEMEAAIVYLANLRSAYWDLPRNGHGWRLIETDCGAMRLLAEGATPLEAVEKALELAAVSPKN